MSYSNSEYEQYEEEYSFYATEENDLELYDGNEPSYGISTQFTFKDDDG